MKEVVHTPQAPQAIGPYSQAIICNGWVFVSGQLGLDPTTGELVGPEVTAQTHQVLRNLKAILEAAGSGLERVVKTTIYLVDMQDFKTVNAIYAEYFHEAPPARATVQVAALPRGGLVEIEAIAAL